MTERLYKANLAKVEAANPKEPLLAALRKGVSTINIRYMTVALSRLPTVLEDELVEINHAPEPKDEVAIEPPSETLRDLWAERTRLFGLMNKQSNKFHECTSDKERAENSQIVMRWWRDICAIKAKIAYYEQHGEVPEEVSAESTLSHNPALLSKQTLSLRARISQAKQKLRELAGLDPSTPGKSGKIANYESKLRDMKHLLGIAEQKIKDYEKGA